MAKEKETVIVRATIEKVFKGEKTYPNKYGPGASRKWDMYINSPEYPDIKRVGWFMDSDLEPPFKSAGSEVYFTLSWKDGETTNPKTGESHSVRYYNVEGVQGAHSMPEPTPATPAVEAPPEREASVYPIGQCPHCGHTIAMEFHKA